MRAVEIASPLEVGSDGRRKTQHNYGFPFFLRVLIAAQTSRTPWFFKKKKKVWASAQGLSGCAACVGFSGVETQVIEDKVLVLFVASWQLNSIVNSTTSPWRNRRSVCTPQSTPPCLCLSTVWTDAKMNAKDQGRPACDQRKRLPTTDTETAPPLQGDRYHKSPQGHVVSRGLWKEQCTTMTTHHPPVFTNAAKNYHSALTKHDLVPTPTHSIDRSAQSAEAIMSEWWRSTEYDKANSQRHVSGDRINFAVPAKRLGRNKCELLVDGQKEMFLIGGSWCGNEYSLGAIPEFTVQLHEKQWREQAILRARTR